VRAQSGVIAYRGTCLNNTTGPCSTPVQAASSGVTNASKNSNAGGSAIPVTQNGEVATMFGASVSTVPLVNNSNFSQICLGAVNGGLNVAHAKETSSGADGPFTATQGAAGDNIGDAASILPQTN